MPNEINLECVLEFFKDARSVIELQSLADGALEDARKRLQAMAIRAAQEQVYRRRQEQREKEK